MIKDDFSFIKEPPTVNFKEISDDDDMITSSGDDGKKLIRKICKTVINAG